MLVMRVEFTWKGGEILILGLKLMGGNECKLNWEDGRINGGLSPVKEAVKFERKDIVEHE